MTQDLSLVGDVCTTAADRTRGGDEFMSIVGDLVLEWRNAAGEVYHRDEIKNLVTSVGDQLYASRGAGLTSSVLPVGMKLGTGTTAVAKTGAGAALVTYLSNSQQAFDATYPQATGGVATYKVTYAAGKATSASNITEVVIYTDATADATSTAANTISRALLASPAPKASGDTLTITWTHTVLGA